MEKRGSIQSRLRKIAKFSPVQGGGVISLTYPCIWSCDAPIVSVTRVATVREPCEPPVSRGIASFLATWPLCSHAEHTEPRLVPARVERRAQAQTCTNRNRNGWQMREARKGYCMRGSPSTVRVSAGSMMPSSHRRAVLDARTPTQRHSASAESAGQGECHTEDGKQGAPVVSGALGLVFGLDRRLERL